MNQGHQLRAHCWRRQTFCVLDLELRRSRSSQLVLSVSEAKKQEIQPSGQFESARFVSKMSQIEIAVFGLKIRGSPALRDVSS